VALRRMSSAFSTFSGALPQEEAALFVPEIKWLARSLGPGARLGRIHDRNTASDSSRECGSHDGLRRKKQGARAERRAGDER